MIKKAVSLSLITFLIQGCNSPDTEAPYVSSDSTFSCGELNRAKAIGSNSNVTAILNTAYTQLDREYIEDTSIQNFYRNLVRQDVDYAFRHARTISENCESQPNNGINIAATDALIKMFNEVQSEPRWATCQSLNEGVISTSDVYTEMRNPTTLVMGGDPVVGPVSVVLNSPNYGIEYLDNEVKETCISEPNQRLWAIYSSISSPISQELQQLAYEEQIAEHERKKEEERQQNLEKFSDSLFLKGIATCENFRDLEYYSRVSDDNEHYLSVLTATLNDMPELETTHHQAAFEEALENDIEGLAHSIAYSCSNDDFISAIMETRQVSSAKSDYQVSLEEMYQQNRSANSCYKNYSGYGMCPGRVVAQEAYDIGLSCESSQNTENRLCFDNPNTIFEYLFLEKIQQEFLRQHSEIQSRINEEIGFSQLNRFMEPCKQTVISRGLRGEDYDREVERICPAQGVEAYRAQFTPEIEKINDELNYIEMQLNNIMSSED